jgi:hypothetical protein
MIRLAPVALLSLAVLVPMCSGTVWGNLLLLLIVLGIFLGTVSLGAAKPAEDLSVAANNKS